MSGLTTQLGTVHYYYKRPTNFQKTLIFLPSFGGDSTYYNYKNIIKNLENHYGVLAIDTIGYGESIEQTMDRTLSNILQNYLDVIEHLNVKNIVLIGHSMEGYHSLYLLKEKLDIRQTILIEPPHSDIAEAVTLELQNFNENAASVTRSIAEGKVTPHDFIESVNPHNSQEDRYHNCQIIFNEFGNTSILSETQNAHEIEMKLTHLNLENEKDNIILLCAKSREEEYKKSQFKCVKKIYTLDGTHYLHWSNEKEVLDIIFETLE